MKKTVILPDKRKLSYIDAGDPTGKVVFYFHGVPSAADEWLMWGSEEKLKALGIRLIAIDRPGVGLSSYQPQRCISDWPKDIVAFADILDIEQFSVLGYSGGGAYAAACAALNNNRIISVGMVSSIMSFDNKNLLDGIDPGNVQFLNLSIQKPLLFRFIYWQIGLLAKIAPKQYLKRAMTTFESADAETFSIPRVHNAIFSAKGSSKGQQLDTKLIISPWDFELQDIKVPLFIWQGGKDHNASPAMGRYLEKVIPNSIMNYLPEEGHISLIVKNAESILKKLIEVE